jgi:hypothetical protein
MPVKQAVQFSANLFSEKLDDFQTERGRILPIEPLWTPTPSS